MQTVTVCAFEVAAIHSVACFQLADDRINGLPAFEHLLFLLIKCLELAGASTSSTGVGLVQAPVAQVDIDDFRLHASRLHQDAGLLELLVQCVAVIVVAGERACADDQIAFQRGGNAQLHTELVRGAAFPFDDAFNFWRVPGVELSLLVGVLPDNHVAQTAAKEIVRAVAVIEISQKLLEIVSGGVIK